MLEPGSYIIRVIVPAFIPGMSYTRSKTGMIQAGNLQDFSVTLAANEVTNISVAVFSSIDCPIPSNNVDLKACADNCNQELNIEVRNSLSELINPDNCVNPRTYTIIVLSPSGSNWTFSWVINVFWILLRTLRNMRLSSIQAKVSQFQLLQKLLDVLINYKNLH